jgi:CubicO group peptidase (beta-lactamase class C family)
MAWTWSRVRVQRGGGVIPLLTLVLILFGGGGCGDGGDGPGQDAGEDAAPVDAAPTPYESIELRFQMEMEEGEVPGAAFAVVEGGEITHAVGLGRRHPDQPAPVETTTLFRLASVTKMMTAVGLLQQVEDGTVALDDSLVDHLGGFAFASDATATAQITVEHLLTHSSGIVDYLTVDATAAYQDATALRDYTYEVFATLGHLMVPPGRMFNYTNPGFVLAGLIVEQASGDFYGAYMADNVLVPLGMSRTLFEPADVLADGDYATGEIKSDYWADRFPSRRVAPDTYDNPWGWPAGFAFSSVIDLGQFVRFLRDGDPSVLADELLEDMKTPRVNTHWAGDIGHYGYGLMVQQGFFVGDAFYDLTLLSHAGALVGFSSELSYVPACDLGFVTLANTEGAYFDDSLEVALQTLCDLPVPVVGPDLEADPADLPDFVGTYHEPWYYGDMIVTRDATELYVEIPGLVMYTDYEPLLIPYARDSFILEVSYQTNVTFVRGAGDQAEFMRTRGFVGQRIDPGSPPPPSLSSSGLSGSGGGRRDSVGRWSSRGRLQAPLALPRSTRRRLRRLLRRPR